MHKIAVIVPPFHDEIQMYVSSMRRLYFQEGKNANCCNVFTYIHIDIEKE